MHDDRFDAFTRDVWMGETRRRLLRRLSVVPLLGAVFTLVPEGEDSEAAHPVRRVQRRRARRRAQRRRRLRRQRRCTHPCGACQRCQQGSCRPTADGAACGNGGECRSGACICPGPRQLCGGKCVHTSTDPLNCGRCGNRCMIYAVCQQGTCVCPKCPNSIFLWQCCAPEIQEFCSICGDGPSDQWANPATCEDNIPTAACPPAQRCHGTESGCDTCCPPGTTCDTRLGHCLR